MTPTPRRRTGIWSDPPRGSARLTYPSPPSPMSYTIIASLDHPDATTSWKRNYCFSDPTTNLKGEPLLDDVTEALKFLCKETFNRIPRVLEIQFTDNWDLAEIWMYQTPEPLIITLAEPVETSGGTRYRISPDSPRSIREIYAIGTLIGEHYYATLCPMLLRYFSEAPGELHFKISPSAAKLVAQTQE